MLILVCYSTCSRCLGKKKHTNKLHLICKYLFFYVTQTIDQQFGKMKDYTDAYFEAIIRACEVNITT